MAKHWSKKKGVVSGAQAAQRAQGAHRKTAINNARKGKAPAPEYRETGGTFRGVIRRITG
jgi:hypothetical protein